MDYGAELLRLRQAAGIAQGALAARMGLRNDQLCRIENGTRTMTQTEYIQAQAALDALVAERQAAWVEARYQRETVS
jgi:transcriptional regulator with XRE-family HTH domain